MAKTSIAPFVKKWVPPVLLDLVAGSLGRRIRISGNYKTWKEATLRGKGYAEGEILLRVRQATEKALGSTTMFERDGVVFEEMTYPFPLIATMLRAAQEKNGKLTVLDFGGSLGSTYYQCKDFLSGLPALKWCVVEQSHFVECGKKEFQTDVLRFYNSIEECCGKESPNVFLFSSVLQYLENPGAILDETVAKLPDYIIIDRTPVLRNQASRIALQLVPQSLGKASYPIRLFVMGDLVKHMDNRYGTLCTFSALDTDLYYRNKLIEFKGIIFKKSK